jgi:hypothetical protein
VHKAGASDGHLNFPEHIQSAGDSWMARSSAIGADLSPRRTSRWPLPALNSAHFGIARSAGYEILYISSSANPEKYNYVRKNTRNTLITMN